MLQKSLHRNSKMNLSLSSLSARAYLHKAQNTTNYYLNMLDLKHARPQA